MPRNGRDEAAPAFGVAPFAPLEYMLATIIENQRTNQEQIMTALENLQAADAALKAEVTTALADFAAKLNSANSANDPAIQAVADDMNALVTQIQAADPATPAPAPAPAPAAPAEPAPAAPAEPAAPVA